MIHDLWNMYDRNKDGYLCSKELKSFLKDLKAKDNPQRSHKVTKQQMDVLIKELDTNYDGKIDLYEFEQLVFDDFSMD